MDDDAVDEAVEDVPTGPFVGALLGVLAVLAGVGWLVAGALFAVPGTLAVQALLVVGGFVLFVASMVRWGPRR